MVNRAVLERLNLNNIVVVIQQVTDAELDEMWSYVGSKDHPRWLWHAIDHASGEILAYVLGDRKDAVFLKLKALLEPFGIRQFYTDDWGAYERHLPPEQQVVGKANTQRIERKHLGSLCVTGCYAKRAVRRGFSRPLPRILTLCTNWKKPK